MTHVTLLVKDYDDALNWYTEKLGLEVRQNTPFGDGSWWVTVGVQGQDAEIVLHKPPGEGGRRRGTSSVHGLVFASDDCRGDSVALQQRGVKVTRGPEEVPWGVQAVFEDLYGTAHVLVEPRAYNPA